MELRELKALQTIAELGSFSLAAKKLCLTQSALSHQIKNLEDELGESLLIRGKRCVAPSPAGVTVLASASQIQGIKRPGLPDLHILAYSVCDGRYQAG